MWGRHPDAKLHDAALQFIRKISGFRGPTFRSLVQFPDLEFRLLGVLPGVGSVVLHYRSIKDLNRAEFMEFDGAGRITRVVAHYTPTSVPSSQFPVSQP